MRSDKLAQLVKNIYTSSKEEFAIWMWNNHLQRVAMFAKDLSVGYGANADLAIAGAWLHDFGDAYTNRHSSDHELISESESIKVLIETGYTETEIKEILEKIIQPHSCKDGFLPTTIEGKILATADALAHLSTDFYLQFSWKHLPEGKSYEDFILWVNEKIDRDYHIKIFFPEERAKIESRYNSLKDIFRQV